MQPPLQSRAVAARRPGEEVTEKKAASKVPKVGVVCKASKEERAQFISFFFHGDQRYTEHEYVQAGIIQVKRVSSGCWSLCRRVRHPYFFY